MTVSDLIRREDAIKAVENNSYGMGSRASVKAIKALPSAEPKTGEWIGKNGAFNRRKCFVCGEYALYEFVNVGSYKEKLSNFCPNCGARMIGE